jgi:hypothetical protein
MLFTVEKRISFMRLISDQMIPKPRMLTKIVMEGGSVHPADSIYVIRKRHSSLNCEQSCKSSEVLKLKKSLSKLRQIRKTNLNIIKSFETTPLIHINKIRGQFSENKMKISLVENKQNSSNCN